MSLSADHLDKNVREWLERFAACVRDRDFDAARAMFDPEVCSFGTWTERMCGIDELVDRQWKNVWPRTCGFAFDLEEAFGHASENSAWAAATWSSRAINEDGTPGFARRGRATFVFRRDAGGELIAMHTHFSMDPAGRL
jgi:ketosteroid isomerase-like protein